MGPTSSMEIRDNMEAIAIVGISGRFPGARNIDQFWSNLTKGLESISFFNDQELEASGIDSDLRKNPNFVSAAGTLEDVELFDASFFGISPKEAETIDPQQRLFLECAWEALENAGYDPERYQGLIGVYAGSSMNTYLLNNLSLKPNYGDPAGYQVLLASLSDFLTTRVSYKLNLKGPSLNIQTACSTSLVAVQLACQSLLNYQCDMALAGGVSVLIPQKTGYLYQEGMIHSPDGHCRTFDAEAKGIVHGSGLGVVVLKRFEDALEEGDHIYAVLKGCATNNDGSLKVGYMAPSVEGQVEVIATAQALAEVDSETITYIEAHGTGTPIGDPIEVAALTQAFSSTRKGYCAIGSVKTNIGHLGAAAGIAGLIKTVLALQYKKIPPSLHFNTPNPGIDFSNSPFYVNTELSEWKTDGSPRRAGVSSFGMGGTNAHVLLEEAPKLEPAGASRPIQLLLLSGKTDAALETASRNLAVHFKRYPDINLADAAYTLQVGRGIFSHKRFVLCRDIVGAVMALEKLDPRFVFSTAKEVNHQQPVVYMFPGQGAQYVGMGRGLYLAEPTFQKYVDFCAEFLRPLLALDLRGVLYPSEENRAAVQKQLQQSCISQPALFVIEYALAKLWQQWGIQPQAMIGHGIGEYVAACLAGVFSLENALHLVVARGKLMQTIGSFEAELGKENISTCRLRTSHAFHSEEVVPISASFIETLGRIALKPPQLPFISNVTGFWITPSEATEPAYWANQLCQTVRFSQGVETLLKEPELLFLEVGPGRTLGPMVRQHSVKSREIEALSSLRHPKDSAADVDFILATLGRLWMSGIQIDWAGFYAKETRRRVPLPTYAFERKRYWVEPRKQDNGGDPSSVQHTNNSDGFINKIERKVAGIWRDLLGSEQLGRHDNFFDLGGDSLMATQVISRLREWFQIDVPLRSIFEAPTVSGLSIYLIQRLIENALKNERLDIIDELDDMSDDDVQNFLKAEMKTPNSE